MYFRTPAGPRYGSVRDNAESDPRALEPFVGVLMFIAMVAVLVTFYLCTKAQQFMVWVNAEADKINRLSSEDTNLLD